MSSKNQRKRVDIVSIRLCKEGSVLYEQRKISNPDMAEGLLRSFLEDMDREALVVLTLDTKNQPNSISVCSLGCLNASYAHPREIFKTAVLGNANSIIIGHNHPSGDPTPSTEDIETTKRLYEAGKILGITLNDHLIIGSEGRYTSMKSRGDF